MRHYRLLLFSLGITIFMGWSLWFDEGKGMPIGVMLLVVACFIPWYRLLYRIWPRFETDSKKPKSTKPDHFRFPDVINIYRLNPYQVLGIFPSEVSMKALSARKTHLTYLIKADLPLAKLQNYYTVAWPNNNGGLTEDNIRRAYAQLENAEDRVQSELLWFHFDGAPNGDFDPLVAGDFEQARQRWTAEATSHSDKFQAARALHNVAILEHALTLANEEASLGRTALSRRQVKSWRRRIELWNRVYNNEECWHYITTRVKASDDPRMNSTYALRLRHRFPRLLLKLHYDLAAAALSQQRIRYAKQHLQLARESGFDKKLSVTGLETTFYQSTFGRHLGAIRTQLEICVKTGRIINRPARVNECLERAAAQYHQAREVDVAAQASETMRAMIAIALPVLKQSAFKRVNDRWKETMTKRNEIVDTMNSIINRHNSHSSWRSIIEECLAQTLSIISDKHPSCLNAAQLVYQAADEGKGALSGLSPLSPDKEHSRLLREATNSMKKGFEEDKEEMRAIMTDLTNWLERQRETFQSNLANLY